MDFDCKTADSREVFVLESFLKWIMRSIYCLLVAVLLYFPVSVLLSYLARKTGLFAIPPIFPVEDSLPFLLCCAVIYAVAASARKKIAK